MSPRTKPGFITFESDIAYSKILSLHCDSRNAILMQPGFTWIAVVLVWQGHSKDMYGPCCPKAPLALCHCQLYLLSNMPRKLVIWSKLLANSLLEKWKKKLLVLKIITPCSSLQVWIFFLNCTLKFFGDLTLLVVTDSFWQPSIIREQSSSKQLHFSLCTV